MINWIVTAFLGCPNPYIQLYTVENYGIIQHLTNIELGNAGFMDYWDLDNSTEYIYFVSDSLPMERGDKLISYTSDSSNVEWFCKVKINKSKKEIIDYEFRPEFLRSNE